jgi:acyl carrier protein
MKTMALAQADVLAGLKQIVEEVAGIPAASVELDKNFTDDLDVDSLSMVEVVVAAEERFGVKIPDESVEDLVTVADAVNFIVNASK